MFTGIVEETGSIRSLRLSGSSGKIAIRAKKSTRRNQDRRQYCGKWCLPDGGFSGKGWIYRRCDGGNSEKNQPW